MSAAFRLGPTGSGSGPQGRKWGYSSPTLPTQRGSARGAKDQAIVLFERIGSTGWADDARIELDRFAVRPVPATGDLTPSELPS
jgi:hypothetical protein